MYRRDTSGVDGLLFPAGGWPARLPVKKSSIPFSHLKNLFVQGLRTRNRLLRVSWQCLYKPARPAENRLDEPLWTPAVRHDSMKMRPSRIRSLPMHLLPNRHDRPAS